jgi:NAD(P)-dependent dehydrogenase (short-subunit alcohol dehydrogenase family)
MSYADLAVSKVNNAAWANLGAGLMATPEHVSRAFATIVYGPLYLIQAAIQYMPKGGRVVNIGSIASKLGADPIYSAAKAAADALTYSLAREVCFFFSFHPILP